jgi:uncharacterized OB-fold protein
VRVVPVPDEQSSPFWAAAAEHHLVLARCGRCQMRTHPPDVVCPNCHHTDPGFVFEPASHDGTVCSWTVMHQSFLPGFEDLVPFVLVDVRIDDADDVRLIGRLLDDTDDRLQLGARVHVDFEELTAGVAVPAFRFAT